MNIPPFLVTLMLLSGNHAGTQMKEMDVEKIKGLASFYSKRFEGRKTAFGEIYNNKLLTAAHPSLPHNTLLEITNLSNNKKVIVRVNDRGPFGKTKRVLDLSRAAAAEIDMIRSGIQNIEYKVVGTDGKLFPDMGTSKLSDILFPKN